MGPVARGAVTVVVAVEEGALPPPRGDRSERLSGAEQDLLGVLDQHTHIYNRTYVRVLVNPILEELFLRHSQ